MVREIADNLRTLQPQFSIRFLRSITANPDRVLWLHPYWIPVYAAFDELCDVSFLIFVLSLRFITFADCDKALFTSPLRRNRALGNANSE
jgi:hypothetical protein